MRYALNTVAVNGSARLYGRSSTAAIVFGAAGFSTKQKRGTSQPALIALTAPAAALKQAKVGRGAAPVVYGAAGAIKRAVMGRASAARIALTAKHGIPDPMPLRTSVAAPNAERMLIVGADQRVVTVPFDARSVVVSPTYREIVVPSETESA